MKLITNDQRKVMLKNAQESIGGRDNSDKIPVVKIFAPYRGSTWLLTEMEEEDGDARLFGLCDLGMGFPELGYVMLSELEGLANHVPLGVERDRHFEPKHSITQYAEEARSAGAIVA